MRKGIAKPKKKKRSILRRNKLASTAHSTGSYSAAAGKSISAPRNVTHAVHVNDEFSWQGADQLFSIMRKLGEGAFGAVYLGKHSATSQMFAMKEIPVEGSASAIEEVKKEIDILRKCKHRCIVSYFGTMTMNDHLYILMDFCDLGSIREMIELCNEPLSEAMTVHVSDCTVQGLVYLHQQQIIHRDVKGANILLDLKGNAKIADFGVSDALGGGSREMIGSPYWNAPEVVMEHTYDYRCDVWSLGITVIEMANGIPPMNDVHPMIAMRRVPTNPAPRLCDEDQFSEELVSFVAQCLVKDPRQRSLAAELLIHPLLQSTQGNSVMRERIVQTLKMRAKFNKEEKEAKENLRESGMEVEYRTMMIEVEHTATGVCYNTVVISGTCDGDGDGDGDGDQEEDEEEDEEEEDSRDSDSELLERVDSQEPQLNDVIRDESEGEDDGSCVVLESDDDDAPDWGAIAASMMGGGTPLEVESDSDQGSCVVADGDDVDDDVPDWGAIAASMMGDGTPIEGEPDSDQEAEDNSFVVNEAEESDDHPDWESIAMEMTSDGNAGDKWQLLAMSFQDADDESNLFFQEADEGQFDAAPPASPQHRRASSIGDASDPQKSVVLSRTSKSLRGLRADIRLSANDDETMVRPVRGGKARPAIPDYFPSPAQPAVSVGKTATPNVPKAEGGTSWQRASPPSEHSLAKFGGTYRDAAKRKKNEHD